MKLNIKVLILIFSIFYILINPKNATADETLIGDGTITTCVPAGAGEYCQVYNTYFICENGSCWFELRIAYSYYRKLNEMLY